MRKHFIWLVMLSGCGTAGGVGTAGVSGGGNPDVQGEWVSGAFPDGSLTGSVQVLKFDSLGRLEAHALRIEIAGIPGFIQPSVTCGISNYVTNTSKTSSPDGFITTALGQRAVTTWNGTNGVVDIFGATGDVFARWELSVRESVNGGTMSATFSVSGITVSLGFQNAADHRINANVPW